MKLKIISTTKQEKGIIEMPEQFSEAVRPDIIKRAVLAIMANKRQPYGVDPEAGKRYVATLSKRRRKYRGVYGKGISRTPRKIIRRSGSQLRWIGAFAPQTVGGRKAHPPKAEKIWKQKINKKERKKAIRSALSATLLKEIVKKRGHIIPDNYPFIIESKIESIKKTKEIKELLKKLGFSEELERASKKTKIRAGKGKLRSRKYKKIRGMLLVVSGPCNLIHSAQNIPGLEVCEVRKLNAEILAPGTFPGRMTLFTEKAIETLKNEKLFTEKQKNIEKKQLKSIPKENKINKKSVEKERKKVTKNKKRN
ncbi:MAG: 50S ribosomal protein L4 [Candidatus Woesearchaeota archaeon]